MDNKDNNTDKSETTPVCPCKRVKCVRLGSCDACREYHRTVKGYAVACERTKKPKKRTQQKHDR